MKVYLISFPQFVGPEFIRFLQDNVPNCPPGKWYNDDVKVSPADLVVENAGRICYMSYGKGRKTNKEFIDNIIQSGHHSVLEHANYTVFITGISRSCSHELVRHRHLSFSQLSQRYVDESESETIMPPVIAQAGIDDVYTRSVKAAKTAYAILVANLELAFKDIPNATLRRKAARQAARSVLPNSTETKIAVTGNVRAWRHFISLRASVHADPEIQKLALLVFELLKKESPHMFGDLKPEVS